MPTLRLAERVEQARDADAYRYETLAFSARAQYGTWISRGLQVSCELGARQRIAIGNEATTESHLEYELNLVSVVGSVAVSLSWGGTTALAGDSAESSRAIAIALHRRFGAYFAAAELFVPRDSDLREQGAYVLGLSVSRSF